MSDFDTVAYWSDFDTVAYWYAECERLRAELAAQKALNLALAERLAACASVLSRAAERGKVCGCQTGEGV